jgi:hypothetical protein
MEPVAMIKKADENNNLKTIQLNKSTIEFYLPYEDVKNALKEYLKIKKYIIISLGTMFLSQSKQS